jgi:hypothetical protein
MASFKHIALFILGAILAGSVAIVPACSASSETEVTTSTTAANQVQRSSAVSQEHLTSEKGSLVSDSFIFSVEVPEAPQPLIIKSESVHIVSDFTPPQARPAAPATGCWVHRGRRERPRTLAGRGKSGLRKHPNQMEMPRSCHCHLPCR